MNRRSEEMGSDRDPASTPLDWYLYDRLTGQSEGKYSKLLQGRMVRMAMAAVRGLPNPQFDLISMPSPMIAKDVIYFYFLTSPVDFGAANEVVQGFPLWQGTGKIFGPRVPGTSSRPTQHEDANWMALRGPTYRVLSNQRDLVVSVLTHMASGQTTRALPSGLAEWQEVDRSADVWGLRHFSPESRPAPGESGCDTAELPFPDCRAIGATLGSMRRRDPS